MKINWTTVIILVFVFLIVGYAIYTFSKTEDKRIAAEKAADLEKIRQEASEREEDRPTTFDELWTAGGNLISRIFG